MCPLMQSGDKLLPLKAEPNQTRSVISVTVLFGFKAVGLTSDKTSIESHPRTDTRAGPCSWIKDGELRQRRGDWGLRHQKATKASPQISASSPRVWGLRLF